ncbi:MAG: glycosyltransferase [Coleofasciculaceae cyanobacterium]
MRVLLSAYECEPNRGREQGRGWNCALQMARLGHEVWVLTPLRNQEMIEPVLTLESLPNLRFVYVKDSVLIRRYIKDKKGTILRYFLWQQQACKVALELDKEHNFDIVHHVTMGSLTGGSWLWRINKPFVFGPAGGGQVAPPAFKKYFLKGWKTEAIRSFIVKQLIPLNPFLVGTFSKTDLVLAANRDTVKLSQQLGTRRAELFFDAGLPEEYFPQQPPLRESTSPELRLLWVARMFPRKALLLALEGLGQVNRQVPFRLSIVGGGTQEASLPGWIKEFGLEGKVDFLGFLSWEEVKHQYLNNDVLLFTSLRDTGGAQLLEAMAQALPIITLNHHGAGDHVPEKAGIKLPVNQPQETVEALAKAVEYMHKNPEERLLMGKVGYEYAKTQTWTNKVQKISQLYEEVTQQKQSEWIQRKVEKSSAATVAR